jgi:hypothetical protein
MASEGDYGKRLGEAGLNPCIFISTIPSLMELLRVVLLWSGVGGMAWMWEEGARVPPRSRNGDA